MIGRAVLAIVVFVSAAFAGSLLWSPPGSVLGQTPPKSKVIAPPVQTKAEPAAKREYADQAMKNSEKGTDRPQRMGPGRCDVVFNNNTSWYIHRVYIDGHLRGSMSPGGRYILEDVAAGPTVLYAEADFDDGSIRKWGPRTFPCPEWTQYTWNMNR
jgi:hypothetical protein